MKIGYARVSRADQRLENQIDALNEAGAEQIFSEKISSVKKDRPALFALLDFARKDDCIVVWRLDRLARSLKHLIEIAADLDTRGIQLISLTENIDTTTTTGKLFFQIFGALAEFERNVIIERTQAGIAAARLRGKKLGRKPVLTPEKQNAVAKLLENNEKPDFSSIGRTVGASPRTIRRFAAGQYKGAANEETK